MKIIRKNPENLAPPIGSYAHLSIIPRDAEILVLSGQVGNDLEGNFPTNIEAQLRNALDNVLRNLASEGVSVEGIVKINIWMTELIDRAAFVTIWNEFHGGNPPSTTLAYVTALVQPAVKVEVEAWAAR
ncbi:RidA family protein [Brevibacillus fulvus]|uniref:Ribosomal-protein-alanine N-acetyltransferase n=1 Tax=Brevibacillus fulvus TaxID=1125967 RepID=A0A939BVZ1_9BACL|nr:RidA family protein [Brevibacillus fulvus]MBM7591241.1 ribosomal-protein-alanine N-acetyltransferase [Brevibacillus fulvus]